MACLGRMAKFVLLVLLSYGSNYGLLVAAEASAPEVRIVRLPEGALVPDVTVDSSGVFHLVYGLSDMAWYVRSSDDGANFTSPVKINSEGKVQLTMGERGPKLAIGRDGSLHVVWSDRRSRGVQAFPRYSRSLDGGKTFEPCKSISSQPAVDGLTVAADGEGNVLAFFHMADPPQSKIRHAHYLYLARSKDNGATFLPQERLQIKSMEDLACSMCMMRARIATDGNVYLAFRTAVDNIRDFYLLRNAKTENGFDAIRVNNDRWELVRCPMCGPELTITPGDRMICAFMSRNKVYWSALDDGQFRLHVATPANEIDEIYPSAVGDRAGNVLFLWQVGPMSISGRATVKWALYRVQGEFTGRQGTVGVSSSGTKPAAFVGTDGNFHIVTTAK